MVIDYSKWDKIDTDSDDEPVAAQPAKAPKQPEVRQTPAQPAQTPTSASSGNAQASSESIKAVIVRCDDDHVRGAKWSETTIPSDHPIFQQQAGRDAPLPAALGIPLALHRLPSSQFRKRPSSLDNQIITYMAIELESGFAPPAWQSEVGTVLVARLDRKPFLAQHLEAVWMYCDHILDLFGNGGGPPRRLYNRAAFEKWWARYVREMREIGRRDWKNVPTPYEV